MKGLVEVIDCFSETGINSLVMDEKPDPNQTTSSAPAYSHIDTPHKALFLETVHELSGMSKTRHWYSGVVHSPGVVAYGSKISPKLEKNCHVCIVEI